MSALALLSLSGGVLLIYCGLTGRSPLEVMSSVLSGTTSALHVNDPTNSGQSTTKPGKNGKHGHSSSTGPHGPNGPGF